MAADNEAWIEAAAVLEEHGDGSYSHIARQVVDAARDGDEAGVARWRLIDRRVTSLLWGTVQ